MSKLLSFKAAARQRSKQPKLVVPGAGETAKKPVTVTVQSGLWADHFWLRTALTALLGLMLVWALPLYELNRSYTAALQESQLRTELGARALREFVESTEQQVDEALLDLREELKVSQAAFENRVQQRVPFLRDLVIQVLLANVKGEQFYTSLRRNAPIISVADRSYFRRFANQPQLDDLNISEPLIGRVSGRWTVQFTRPLLRDGLFDGTVTISVNPAWLTSEMATRFGFDNSVAEVWKGDSQLLSRSPEDVALYTEKRATGDWLMQTSGFKQSPLDGEWYLCSVGKSGPSQLHFVVCEPRVRVLKDFLSLQLRVLLVCLLLSALLLVGIVLYLQTQRDKRASQSLLKLNEQILASSQQVARLGDYIWNLQDQTLTSSKNLNDILGFGNETVLPGHVFFSLIVDEDREAVRRALAVCAQEKKPVDIFFRWSATIFRPQLWLRLHGHYLDRNSDADRYTVPYVVGIIKDVTDIKQREQSLILAKVAAEEANQAKFEFLATMSHELRTPIFGINAGMEIALRNPDLDDRTRRSLVASLKSAKHLNQLVDDVLDFAKLDSRALQLDAKPFRVRQALLAVIDLFGERAAEKQLMLTLDDRELAEDSLLGDERRFRQIFFNLVGNAIKFTATGGISLAATSQLTERGDVMLSVTVSDTGIGIPTEQLSRLFSPFEQGSVQTGVRYGGTGLGLSISRQLTQLMGGDITVRSEPGHGSHFRVQVTLPRAV